MQIRRAIAEDVDEIARIVNAAFEIERSFRRGPRTSPAEVVAMMSGDSVFLVAHEDGRLLGAVEVRARGQEGYFGMLAVDSSVRRGGIGRAPWRACGRVTPGGTGLGPASAADSATRRSPT